MSHSSAPERATGAVITDWRPEDPAFWQQRGQRIASRNLWISVPCLLLAFFGAIGYFDVEALFIDLFRDLFRAQPLEGGEF